MSFTELVTLTIEGRPFAKARARSGKFGFYTPESTRAYEKKVAWTAKAAMKGKRPATGALYVSVVVFFAIPETWTKKKRELTRTGAVEHISRPDLDNLIKSATDGCNGIVWKDDAQIVWMEARKQYTDGSSRVEMYVAEEQKDATGN